MVKCIILLMAAVILPTVPLYADSQPRQLSEAELEKLRSNVQKSKARAAEELAEAQAKAERDRQELAAYDAWLEQDAAARRPAQQNIASVFMNTFNSEMQKSQAQQAAFNARIANTIQTAQQQKQKGEQTRQAQLQREAQARQSQQTHNSPSNSTSQQTSKEREQNREQALRDSAARERQRLQQEQQRKQEMEQKQQALTKKREEEKRQKELERKKQEDLRLAAEAQKKQELLDYNRAIRVGTRVGAISCHSGQSTRIVGVLGRAQRPQHIYNNCQLREVRYRCPSESSWQHYSNGDWLLNNACMGGIGDDVTVNVNCPAEQLIVQATRFSCDVK